MGHAADPTACPRPPSWDRGPPPEALHRPRDGARRRGRRPRVTGTVGLPRRSWGGALWRILERDERVFAVLLAVVMVGGLASIGLFPLRPSRRFDVVSLVAWFAVYKAGVFALVTVVPRATRTIFGAACAVDLLLVFVLLYITGGADSVYYLLFFPLVAVNAYYFGPWVGLLVALTAGLLYAAAA